MPARVSGRVPDYLFGQSAGEAERLRLQARMFAPYTARFLQDAGISPGMKVLDVGTGAGDVALLAAGLAGQQGTVVGIDFNAELIQTARTRAAAAGMENVSFAVGDAAMLPISSEPACAAPNPALSALRRSASPGRKAGGRAEAGRRSCPEAWPCRSVRICNRSPVILLRR
jgi:SAM-dependent methyltransferase